MLLYPFVLLSASVFVNSTSLLYMGDGKSIDPCYGDKNATYKRYPELCPGTCKNPNGVKNCYKTYTTFGCECNPGYVLSDSGKCILLKDCPANLRCDRNATYKVCPAACPRTCELPAGPDVCTKQCLKEGCECKIGYHLDTNGECVHLQDCSGAKKCTANETFVYCKMGCPSIYCPVDDSMATIACSPSFPCTSGCSCKSNYLRKSTKDDRCILATDCPPVNCTRPNEEWNPCVPPCPFNKCTDIGKPTKCDKPYFFCKSQCDCKKGFYRNNDSVCVPKKDCPPACGHNEVAVKCKTVCPPQTCNVSCPAFGCNPEETVCEPGCDCLPNHLRNASGICVPEAKCPPRIPQLTCGYNEMPSYCKVMCPPQSCESIHTTYSCNNTQSDVINEGCNCLWGYLRNKTGICVPSEQCFSEPECDISIKCRPTCSNPNPKDCPNFKPASENQDGCKCKSGYILSEADGVCIEFEKCPNGNPCGVNGTFSDCGFRCPNQNCPIDDNRSVVACKPSNPCLPGCLCKDHYKRNASDICVLVSDCAPIQCSKPNEVWEPFATNCLAEKCDDIDKKSDCAPDLNQWVPRCVCYKGFYRNKDNICVPKYECPSHCDVEQRCRPTCANPNPPNCPSIKPADKNVDDCNCQFGFILSEFGGKCIKIEQCPNNIGCNGDMKAKVKTCPMPCPPTCDKPNVVACNKSCDTVGCECLPGYMLSKLGGQCVLPENCKGGNPCGPNATFVRCKHSCPLDFCPVDDSRAKVACETHPFAPCFPGCDCKINHKVLSRKDRKCILASECPPVNCTRPKEIWNSCPQECHSGYCDAVGKPSTGCNSSFVKCKPSCVCKNGFYRNPENDLCIAPGQCQKIIKKNNQTKVKLGAMEVHGNPLIKILTTNFLVDT